MKIKVYQSGGIVYLPTTNRREGVANTAASSSSNETKVPGFTKELISIIDQNGLDNDVAFFLKQIEKTLDLANDPTGEGISMREILKAQQLANRVRQNYHSYETAEKSLESQDAWDEPATTARGMMYVKNLETGKIEELNPSQYNSDKYQSLTNADLMYLRRENPEMAFQNNILDNLSQSVGMKTITDYVGNIIKQFGKTNITGYSEKQTNRIKSGMDAIISGEYDDISKLITEGPDGIYKIAKSSTVADNNIIPALQYILSTLPDSHRYTLNAKAAAEGYDPQAMLFMMMMANTDRTISADYDSNATKVKSLGIAGSSGSEALTEDNLAIRFAKGDLTQTTAYISPKASRVSDKSEMALQAWNGGAPQNDKGDHLQKNNMADLLPNIFQFAGCDMSSITFGNQLINNTELQGLVWDGSSAATRVALPYKIVNGKVTPDFDLLISLNKINEKISNTPGMPKIEIQRELENLQADGIIYDDESKRYIIDPSRIAFFATLGAYGSNDLLDLKKESLPFVELISRRDGKMMKDEFNNLVQYGKPTHNRKEKPKNGLETSEKGDFFIGNIYIPINDPMQAVNTTKNQFYPKSTFTHVNEKYKIGQQIAAGQQQSSWKLNF